MADHDYFDCQAYVDKYWPRVPANDAIWRDCGWLLREYDRAARHVSQLARRPVRYFDISTGPTLAHLIAMVPVVDDAQLSDFSPSNRRIIRDAPVDRWRVYVEEALVAAGETPTPDEIDARLAGLDRLRRQNEVVDVDVRADPIVSPAVASAAFDVVSMHFVADSITDARRDYWAMLDRVVALVGVGGVFVMSAMVDSSWWSDAASRRPSPNVSVDDITGYLGSLGLGILRARRIADAQEGDYEGSMAVFTAVRLADDGSASARPSAAHRGAAS